jgi:pimeloyl-ACP methyl ester carboxylesterase
MQTPYDFPMTPAVSSVVLGIGITLSYAAVGDPLAPVVVLLSGPTDSWAPTSRFSINPLSVRAIAVSQRGHVDSDKPPTGYRVEDFATSNEDRGSQARTVGLCPTAWSAGADKVVRLCKAK